MEHLGGIRDWSMVIFLAIFFGLWVRLITKKEQRAFSGWNLMELYEQ